MNTLLFKCPDCAHQMQLPEAMIGQKGECPNCSEVIVPIPVLGSLSQEEASPPKAAADLPVDPEPPPVVTDDGASSDEPEGKEVNSETTGADSESFAGPENAGKSESSPSSDVVSSKLGGNEGSSALGASAIKLCKNCNGEYENAEVCPFCGSPDTASVLAESDAAESENAGQAELPRGRNFVSSNLSDADMQARGEGSALAPDADAVEVPPRWHWWPSLTGGANEAWYRGMGTTAFANEHLTEGETIVHAARFHPVPIWMAYYANLLFLVSLLFVMCLSYLSNIPKFDGKGPPPQKEVADAYNYRSAVASAWAGKHHRDGKVDQIEALRILEDAERHGVSEKAGQLLEEWLRIEPDYELLWEHEKYLTHVRYQRRAIVAFALGSLGALALFTTFTFLTVIYLKNVVCKTEFVLTDKRIIAKWGFLRTVIHELPLNKIESINYGQTFIERSFWYGIGRLTVRGTGGSKIKTFKFLVGALEFRKQILDQIDKASQ